MNKVRCQLYIARAILQVFEVDRPKRANGIHTSEKTSLPNIHKTTNSNDEEQVRAEKDSDFFSDDIHVNYSDTETSTLVE